jgi:deoxyribodipyrimidine photo-lyase
VPLFVVDPLFTARAGAPRLAYLARALRALDEQIGGALVYRHGDPVAEVCRLTAEVGAGDVFVSRDFGPYGRRRDAAVAEELRRVGGRLHGIGSPYAVEPGTVTKPDGTPYAVFTPFSRTWLNEGRPRWALRETTDTAQVTWMGAPDIECDGPPIEPQVSCELPAASAGAVRECWDRFVAGGLDEYDSGRNFPANEGTSRLSTALRWGLVHPCELIDDLASSPSHDTFRTELAWRDFYADVLFRRPETAWSNLQHKMDSMPVDIGVAAEHRFQRWCDGETGFPIVDAGMRQLLATGWMHNRVRMIVASFLVKDLHLPWQWGARHFLRHLVDGDLASNNHGWQWAAGTGTDAAPYFRVFNPTTQSERYDPEGDYIRRWVPQLADLDGSAIHDPGRRRPESYPTPMVDHAVERDEALRRYRSLGAATR